MTQSLDNVTAPIHSAFKSVDVTCSCTKCDSNYCFGKRRDEGSCSCENCSEPKTCLFYGKKANKNRSNATNTGPVFSVTSGTGTRRFLWDASTNTNNPSKISLELYKSMLETSKLKIDALKSTYFSGTYKRDLLKNGDPHSSLEAECFERQRPEPSNYTIELSKSVLETQKIAVEPLKKIYLPSKSCDESSKKSDYHIHILETRWDTIELPENRFLPKKDSCDCSDCLRNEIRETQYLDDPPGYIFECPKPSNITKTEQELSKSKPETKTNRIEPVTNTNEPALSCNCDGIFNNKNDQTILRFFVNVIPNVTDSKKNSKDTIKFKYELCNNILEIQKNIMEKLNSIYLPKEKTCDCKEMPKKKPNPVGYIYEVPKCTQEPTKPGESYKKKSDTLNNKFEKDNNCNCDHGPNNTSRSQFDSPGYVFDLNKYKYNTIQKDNNYNSDDGLKNTCREQSDLPGYVFDLNKYKNNPVRKECCNCGDGPKNKACRQSDSVGYVYELNKYKDVPISTNNTTKKDNCNCDDGPKNTSWTQFDSPGYVFELPKYTHDQSKKDCNCEDGLENKSQKKLNSVGYVFELNKYKDKPIPTNDPRQFFKDIITKESCNCDNGTKNAFCRKSESVGYIFELNKYKDKPIPTNNIINKDNCNCNDGPKNTSLTQSDSPGYVFELQKYEHDQIQKDSNCNCDQGLKNIPRTKSDSPGYVFDLNKNNFPKKDSCNCKIGVKNTPKNYSDTPGYVFELNKDKPIPSNNIPITDNCKCDDSPKSKCHSRLDTPGYIFDLNKNNLPYKDGCNCDDGEKNTSRKYSDSPGYVFELNKDIPIPSNNIPKTEICKCDDSPKSKCRVLLDSPGYIFDLNKNNLPHKDNCNCGDGAINISGKYSDSPGYVFELNKDTQIPSNNIPKTEICKCDDSPKSKCRARLDSPGYIFDLNKNNLPHRNSFNCDDDAESTSRKYSDSPGYVFELNKDKPISSNNIPKTDNCKCDDSPKSKCHSRLDSPGYIFDLNKNNLPKKDSCNCDPGSKNTSRKYSDSPGYVFELNKDKPISSNNIPKTDNCKCDDSPKSKCHSRLDSPGYIFDLNKNNLPKKDSCNCDPGSKNTSRKYSDSPGYVFELNKDKPISSNNIPKTDNCKCDDSPKSKCHSQLDSPGYIFDLNKNNLPKKDSCNCDVGHKNTSRKYSDSPGYVFKLNKDKPISSNNIPKTDNCKCNDSPKIKCRTQLDSPGYIFDLNKNNLPHRNSCNCDDGAKITSRKYSDSPGYVFELNKVKPSNDIPKIENCKCDDSLKRKCHLRLDSPGYIFDLNKNNLPDKDSCNCDDSVKNISRKYSDSPGYVFELNKDKPIPSNDIPKIENCKCDDSLKSKFRARLDSPGYVFDLNNINLPRKVICNCKSDTKNTSRKESDSRGYIYELSKYKQESIPVTGPQQSLNKGDSCNCNSGSKNTSRRQSDSPGYIYDLNKYKQETTPMNALQQSFNKGDSCNCNSGSINTSRRQSDSPGYIYDLKNYKQKPIPTNEPQKTFNNTNSAIEEDSCNCNYGTKNTSRDAPGYVLELNKIKPMITNDQKNCNCHSKGYILRLDKYKKKPYDSANNREIFVNRLETPKCAMETLNNINRQKICECRKSGKSYSELPGYVFDLPKSDTYQKKSCDCNEKSRSNPAGYVLELHPHAYEPSKNTQELCKSIIETQMGTFQTVNNVFNNQQNNNTYDCNKAQFQNTLDIYNLRGTPKETQSSCNCPESLQTSEQLNGTNSYIQEMKRKLPGSKTMEEFKRIYLPKKTPKYMLETPRIQIDKLKEIYLPKKNKIESKETNEKSKNALDLCKASTNKIETLKNIYMPPRFTVDYTKKYEYPDTSDSRRNIDGHQPLTEACCREEINSGTAMLSAEIMNMPYTKFNHSLVQKQSDSTDAASKLTKYDILSRIKEAYKACSCKVCECIVGKPVETTVCNCQPCECNECAAYLDNSGHLDDDIKCHCARCNKNQCLKAALEIAKLETCDCKPCDCIKCTKGSANLCDCEPCQCDDCKPKSKPNQKILKPQTYVVLPVEASAQRIACSCSPCDCIECGQTYPLASTVMHEMSSGTNRHELCRCEVCLNETCDQSGVNACKCERRNKVMSKPVENDSHDYDIRTATVVKYKRLHHDGKKRNKKFNTIAMFAALQDKYPTFASTHRLANTKTCNCEECECISCICKEDAINAIKSSQLFSINKTKTTSNMNNYNKSTLNRPKSWEYNPCECQICEKYTDDNLFVSSQVLSTNEKSCVCFTCDCLDCNGEHRNHKYSTKESCKCSLCECKDCQAKIIKDPHTIVSGCQCSVCGFVHCFGDEISRNTTLHHIKKDEVVTPSNHQIKVKSMILEKHNLNVPSYLIRKVSSNKDNTNTLSKHDYHYICNFDTKSTNKSEILKGNSYIHFQEQHKGRSSLNNNLSDHEISGSYFSGYSSFETSPKTSGYKGCGSITPISRKKTKSWESSCNSSGHDNPEYLIQFPKSTVEACLKDVIELDIDKTSKLNGFNFIPNSNSTTKPDVDKEKLYQTHKSNLIDSSDSKSISIKQTGLIKQHKRKNNLNQRNYKYQNDREENDLEIKDKNLLQDSGFIKSSISSLRSYSENCNYFNVNSNEFHSARKVFDYNVAEENSTLFPIHNERYCTWRCSKQLPDPYFVNTIDILNIDEDNKRVQKTLKEAKEFSLELTKLLEMYEKANKEFESISEKLKISHGSLFSVDIDVTKESCSIEENIMEKCIVGEKRFSQVENELQEIHLEAPSVREKLTSTSILQDKGRTSERTIVNDKNGNNIYLQNLSAYKDILNYHKVRESIQEYDLSPKMNSVFDNNLLERIETHLKNNEVCFESVANDVFQNDKTTMKSGFKSEENRNSYDKNEEIVQTVNEGIKTKGQINSKNYKKYSKLLKRTIIISKRISVNHSNRMESNPIGKHCVTVGTSVSEINTKMDDERNTLLPVKFSVKDNKEEYGTQKYRKHELNQITNKLNTVFGNIEDVSVCTSTDTYGLDKDLAQYELEDAGIDAKIELKKCLEVPVLQTKYPYHRTLRYCTKESLNLRNKNNLELKESPQLSLHRNHKDVKNVDKEVWCPHTRKSMEDKVRNLLDLSEFLPLIEKKKELDDNVQTTTRISSIGGAKSSCDALKVGFLGVRRVSDHTVLVKWNVPQVLSKVKGYELLVDGRAVQKIFSPSKCMAVVTCLPHTDKVLLTIRTIISGSSVSMTGHYPATTIIYRPRVK